MVFTATDQNGVSASDVVSFDVLAAGQTDLIEEYADVNDAFNNAGDDSVRAMVATAADQIYGANNDVDVLQFDGSDPAATGAVVLDDQVLPDNARDLWLDEAGGRIYLATQDGLVVCDHDAVTGIDASACDTFQDGDIPGGDTDLRAVALVTGSDGADYLIYGNDEGILIADDSAGSDTGTTDLAGIEIRDIAVDGSVVWIGTNGDGLYRYDPVSGDTQSWDQGDGAPSDAIVTVAVGTDGMIWVGTNNGLGRLDPGAGTWTVWRQFDPPAPGLISNSVRAIAIHHVDIGGVARDVIWIGCGGFGGGFGGGVSRFDPTVPSFTNFTTADGLPSNNVRSIVILSDGTKVFGTDNGVARYVGL